MPPYGLGRDRPVHRLARAELTRHLRAGRFASRPEGRAYPDANAALRAGTGAAAADSWSDVSLPATHP